MQSEDFKSFTITQDGDFVAEFDLISIDDSSYVPYDIYVDEIVKVFE